MLYVFRRNTRYNGRCYRVGDKYETAVLDEIMRNNLRAGVIDIVRPDKYKKKATQPVTPQSQPQPQARNNNQQQHNNNKGNNKGNNNGIHNRG